MNVSVRSGEGKFEPLDGFGRKVDADRIYSLLALAFATDPPCRWMYPDPLGYTQHFTAFARAFAGAAFDHSTALAHDEGAALWLPPGYGPDEHALAALIETSVDEHRRSEVFDLFAEMDRVHPSVPHWYLPLLGVDPIWQRYGHGGRLIEPILAICDTKRLPAYLEATSPRSVPLYERFGFEPVGSIDVGSCPQIIPMWRRPGDTYRS